MEAQSVEKPRQALALAATAITSAARLLMSAEAMLENPARRQQVEDLLAQSEYLAEEADQVLTRALDMDLAADQALHDAAKTVGLEAPEAAGRGAEEVLDAAAARLVTADLHLAELLAEAAEELRMRLSDLQAWLGRLKHLL